jgi:hypothetical protein
MPTYFARKAGNINATDVWATAPAGTASAVTFVAGDVLMANSFAITVNVSTDLGGAGQVRNDATGGATAGGSFTLSNGVTLTANVFGGSGTSPCVTFLGGSGTSATIVGNCAGGAQTAAHAASNSSTGTLSITGNCTGGGLGGNGCSGAVNSNTGTLSITGNCTGGIGGSAGSFGALNSSTGTLSITGNCTGGAYASGQGANNASTGILSIIGTVTASVNAAGVAGANVQQTTLLTGPFITELTRGTAPVYCAAWRWNSSLSNSTYLEVATSNFGTKRNLYTADNITGMPAASNVKTGVTYGPVGELTGTFNFVQSPSAADIQAAVWSATTRTITGGLVDTATTLTNAPTVPTPSQIASQVRTELSTELSRLDVATSTRAVAADIPTSDISAIKAKTDNLPASPAAVSDIPTADIAAIKAATDNLPSDPADQSLVEAAISALSIPSVVQIRTELDSNSTKLANLDATISSRSTLTTGDLPSVPSAASVASAVRTELTELSNLDASVSSRLASAAYTAPTSAPTAAAVASAVRTELTELSNLDASVSSRLASASYTAPANSDISAIKSKTDNLPASPAAVSDIPTTAQISAAVEGSLLNEGDGQAVLNAIVGAIGNQNLSEVSLVAAIRSDLERVGGKIDSIPTSSAPSASTVAGAVRTELATELGRLDASVSSRLSPSGTLATVTNLTNAPASVTPADIWDYNARTLTSASGPTAIEIRQELDSNSTQLSAIKSKTDALPSDPADQSLLEAAIAGVAAPSAATVASAVRSELSTELTKVSALNTERLANVATTAIVGNLIAQANS